MNWCYNEPWINAANNCLITYPAKVRKSYFAVKNSLRSQLPTARVEKFDWKNGEIFKAELWYLNDSPESARDKVEISVIIGDNEYKLLDWNVGEVEPCSNKIGPSVNFKLPEIYAANKLILKLKSKYSEKDNEYILLYRCIREAEKTPRLNR